MAEDGKGIPLARRGDPIEAKRWNDVLRSIQTLTWKVSALEKKTGKDQTRVLVRNDTGADITVDHGIVGIGDSLIDPFDAESPQETYWMPQISGEEPSTEDHEGKFAILCGAVKQNQYVEAIVAGTTWVRVLVNDTGDDFAEMEDGEVEYLKTATGGGCQILFLGADEREDEEEEDIRWALVRFGSTGGSCHEVHQLFIDYAVPTTGDATLTLELDDDTSDEVGPVSDVITIPYDATKEEVRDAYAEHSVLAALITGGGDIDDYIQVWGGPFPSQPIYVRWIGGFSGRAIGPGSPNSTGLDTGTFRVFQVSSADWTGY